MMFQSLSDYDNNQLMEGICSVAYIRRRECVWAIEQAIAMTYQMQGAWNVVGDRLTNLNTTIHCDVLNTLDQFKTQAELDFLFPEITRIHDHDLAALGAWKNHIDWYQELSPNDLEQLSAFTEQGTEGNDTAVSEISSDENYDDEPTEYSFYEEAKEKFEPVALYGSLRYLFDKEARSEGENYVAQRAQLEDLSALSPHNLKKASPLALANLKLYFAESDESLETDTKEKIEATASSR
ncbi:MAG: hypothetical protein AAFV85_28180 [Cyanobacteria bacterium J06634_6]